MNRESMPVDVVIVGAGPAGLATAIRLAQLAQANQQDRSIVVVEKGAEVGAHILAGAVLETRALDELIPDWKNQGAPITTEVSDDQFLFMTERSAFKLPTPPAMNNHGNYVISLGLLTRWLAEQAESLGVDIYPGFAAAEVLYHDDGSVKGIATSESGVNKDGSHADSYDPGMELHAEITVFAEGCRGSLTRTLIDRFDLRKNSQPQTYALGIKELWEIPEDQHHAGKVIHTIGWPLDTKTYGGSFIYHMGNGKIAIGFAVGLDYQNPYLSPFEEFQRFKTHPKIRAMLKGGNRISYGARALSEGGYQSIPTLTFPGGMLVGDTAGFLNVPKIKGTHTAMKSGMLAAETLFAQLNGEATDLSAYRNKLEQSWLMPELKAVRNIRPAFGKGLWVGLANAGLTAYLTRGKEPWTLSHHEDHQQLRQKSDAHPIDYPAPDGVVSFDRLSSVYLSNTNHEENQPAHLTLNAEHVAIDTNLALYDAPEQRYCPAGVYEINTEGDAPELVINAQNCLHCKTCDIKDPTQNIVWKTPEGGGGPLYSEM